MLDRLHKIPDSLELEFTIDNKLSIAQMAAKGTPYPHITERLSRLAMSKTYTAPIIIPASDWELPVGTWGEMNGPG